MLSLEYQREHRIIFTITGSLKLENYLPSSYISDDIESIIKNSMNIIIKDSNFRSISLDELSKLVKCCENKDSDSNSINLNDTRMKYRFVHTDILDFGGLGKSSTTYEFLENARNNQGNIISNEWAIIPKDGNKESDLNALYDILLTLGRQRNIFIRDMRVRIFNIALPVMKIVPRKVKENDNIIQRKFQEEVRNYILFPNITLIQKPKENKIRRTYSLSFIIIPVDDKFEKIRPVDAHEIKHMINDAIFELYDCPFKNFLSERGNISIPPSNIIDIFKKTSYFIYEIFSGDKLDFTKDFSTLDNEFAPSIRQTIGILSGLIEENHIREFYNGSISKDLYELLNVLIFPEWHLSEFAKRPDAVNFKDLAIKDRTGMNTGYFVFFNPDANRTVFIMTKKYEQVSDYSSSFEFTIKWAAFWYLYMDISISSLKTMIHSFYNEIPDNTRARKLLNLETELVNEIEEFYELEIHSYLFRDIYKRLRELAGLEDEFRALKEKLEALKTNVVIRQQNLLNLILITMTALLVLLAIISQYHVHLNIKL